MKKQTVAMVFCSSMLITACSEQDGGEDTGLADTTGSETSGGETGDVEATGETGAAEEESGGEEESGDPSTGGETGGEADSGADDGGTTGEYEDPFADSGTAAEEEESPAACDGYTNPGINSAASGMAVAHLKGLNGYGEEMSLCDYAGSPTIVDFSFWGCGPCEFLASWLAGQEAESEDANVAYYLGDTTKVALIKEKLEAGELRWVTILTGDPGPEYGPITLEGAKLWHETWPTDKAEVMFPQIKGIENPYGFFGGEWGVIAGPTIGAIYKDFTWAAVDFSGWQNQPGDTMDGFLSKSFE